MKQNYTKAFAGILAAAMIFGGSSTAFAAGSDSGGTSGAGELEGTIKTDVFAVVLPTVPVNDTTFDFILDPEGLIASTSAAAHSGKTFESGATLFFANADASTDYSSSSVGLTVVNKSTMSVDVKLTAAISNANGITLTDDNTFAGDTSASLYLALTDGTNTSAIGKSGCTLTAEVAGAPAGAYKINYNATDEVYEYILDSGASPTFEELTFNLTGASNKNGDWSGLTAVKPSVDVAWTVTEHQDNAAPSIATKNYTMTSNSPVVVNVNLGVGNLAATGIKSITYLNSTLAVKDVTSSSYTFADGKLTFTSTFINSVITVASREYTVTFNDAAATTVTITLVN